MELEKIIGIIRKDDTLIIKSFVENQEVAQAIAELILYEPNFRKIMIDALQRTLAMNEEDKTDINDTIYSELLKDIGIKFNKN